MLIRNVPDELHRKIKARAALAGMSMSDFLLAELRRTLERPSREALLRQVANSTRIEVSQSAAEVLHEERELR